MAHQFFYVATQTEEQESELETIWAMSSHQWNHSQPQAEHTGISNI